MIFENIRFVLFVIILYVNKYDCSIDDLSLIFAYKQSNDSFEEGSIVRRSLSNIICGKDLTCYNSGKCKEHQCHCSEHFIGHDCSIAQCGQQWCSQIGGKCKRKHCQCLTRFGGFGCSGVKCDNATSSNLICYNGGTCNNTLSSCDCRPGYHDNGSGCLIKVCSNGDLCYTHNGHCTTTGCKCRSNQIHGSDCSQKICGKSGLVCYNGGMCINEKYCKCLHGWTGATCNNQKCPDFTDLVCHSSTCPASGSAPICQCPKYTKGKDCSGIVCGTNGLACYNGGTCDAKTSKCSCVNGYGGPDCKAVQCTGYPNLFCYNDGCPPIGHDSEAQCICTESFTGADCSQVMCSHSAVTCYNGGECLDGRSCTCPSGYGGIDCRGVPCGSGYCYNGGQCSINTDGQEMECLCPGNYTLSDCSGEKCSRSGLICYNGANCEEDENGHQTCRCTGQWAGADCSATSCQHNLCYNGGYCDDDENGEEHCVCVNGWQGIDCRAKSCGLDGKVCHHDGLCVSTNGSTSICQCKHPWSGSTCQEQICGVEGLVCKNNGVCSLTTTKTASPTCVCPAGFTGDDCSAVICGSNGNACFNGGLCNETTGTCICTPPLTSDDCRGNICGTGTANSIVCQNDGICIMNSDGEWTCNCTQGWTGPYCMLRMCGEGAVTNLVCAHEGNCVYSSTAHNYVCSCQPQWTGVDCSGMQCPGLDIACYNQVDFDASVCTPKGCDCLNDGYGADCRGVRCGLEPGRCYNGAICIDGVRGICSSCPPGVSGHDCSIMRCAGVKSGHCYNGGICVGGNTCLCGLRSEWSGVDCSEKRCSGNYICLNGGSCSHHTSKRECTCPPAFTGPHCEVPIEN